MNSKEHCDFDQTCLPPSAPVTTVSDVSPVLMVGVSGVGSVRRERKGTGRFALISTIAQDHHVIQVTYLIFIIVKSPIYIKYIT